MVGLQSRQRPREVRGELLFIRYQWQGGGTLQTQRDFGATPGWLLQGHVSSWGVRLLSAASKPGGESKGHIRCNYLSSRGAAESQKDTTKQALP